MKEPSKYLKKAPVATLYSCICPWFGFAFWCDGGGFSGSAAILGYAAVFVGHRGDHKGRPYDRAFGDGDIGEIENGWLY